MMTSNAKWSCLQCEKSLYGHGTPEELNTAIFEHMKTHQTQPTPENWEEELTDCMARVHLDYEYLKRGIRLVRSLLEKKDQERNTEFKNGYDLGFEGGEIQAGIKQREERKALLEGIEKELEKESWASSDGNHGDGDVVVSLQDAIAIIEKHL